MKRTRLTRLALPVLAALITSAIVAAGALGVGGSKSTSAKSAAKGPDPTGQLVIDGKTIPVLSFSAGVSNPGSVIIGGGGGAGKANFSDLSLMTPTDANTPVLLAAVATGKHFATATFTATFNGGTFKYDLDDVLITSVQHSGSGGDLPSQSMSLTFAKVTWTFTDANGTVTRGFDIANNRTT
jgi:type VI secretion system secreted protein Hcp